MATYNLLGFDSTNNLPILPSSADTANVQGDLTVAGDQIVTGNLTVNGTTTTVNSEIATADDQIHLNSSYTNTSAAKDAGLIFTVEPLGAAYSIASFGGGAFKDNMTLASAVSGWAAGDIIQISGCEFAENNGLYELEGQDNSTRFYFKALAQGDSISSSLVDICQLADFTQGSVTAGTAVEVKVMQFKTDEASNQFVYKYGSSASNMSANQTFGGSPALTDITAGTGNALLTTATGDITIEVDTAQALKMQINSADKMVIDGTDIKVKAGNNLLIESTASLAQQLTFVGGSAVAENDLLYLNASGQAAKADADAGGLAHNVIGVALEAGGASAATHQACTYPGQAVVMNFGSDLTSGDTGKPAYLSTTAGRATITAPSASGDQVVRVGYVIDGSSNVGSTGLHQVLFMPQFISTVS